ncbi:MAG: cyclic nucleotide-binding domain-containing protein [Rhodoferax sp.]|uniref:Crp/Fnr family transcriptional regulator n=1 Tax=Rhodoferax sp. TaxID=50421 RepID=UPI0026023940|nr:cyclic nucleotide-binding domain-containing protein [Rhodoferax sp.]MDD5333201.1 cyclic nucleotide-binding domain-containing protein [Rhodoferax sp.]
MKGMFGVQRQNKPAGSDANDPDSKLFSSTLSEADADPNLLVPWEARAVEVGATKLDPEKGIKLLQALWRKDKYMRRLDPETIRRMQPFLDFATIAADRDLIRQDERGNFMLVLLSGTIAIDRLQPWGERLRLAEAAAGEILGEMSLLDGGIRFSVCSTLSNCQIAVLSADAMDQMLGTDPTLTANLVTLLARKLSLRLRGVSARLSETH